MKTTTEKLLAVARGPERPAPASDHLENAAEAPRIVERPINILIVDDEPANLVVLETVLDDPAYRLVRAQSADQALLALIEEEFALLILDIRMPGMTGFELAQMIKERKKTAYVPIIFLTAYYDKDQHELEGYATGAVDYLNKPVNPAVLRSKVSVFADLHRKNRTIQVANGALTNEVAERRRAEEQLRDLNETRQGAYRSAAPIRRKIECDVEQHHRRVAHPRCPLVLHLRECAGCAPPGNAAGATAGCVDLGSVFTSDRWSFSRRLSARGGDPSDCVVRRLLSRAAEPLVSVPLLPIEGWAVGVLS